MKKNTKFLLMYIAILFSFALVLILFAGLTQNNYAKELAKSQGIQQNLVEVTEQYQALTDEVNSLNTQLESAKETITTYEEDITQKASYYLASEKLIQSLQLYDEGKFEEAQEIIKDIDKAKLSENQLYIYNKIFEQGEE